MDVKQAAQIVRDGGVIAYPTEAVWGFGCDPWNEQAVHRILAIKQRAVEKGVILIGGDVVQFQPIFSPLEDHLKARLMDSWPGPNTWLIEDEQAWTPSWIRGQFSSVAVRVSDHDTVRQLAELAGTPLVSTSVNVAGEEPLSSREQVVAAFGDVVDAVVFGETAGRSTPSQIRRLTTGEVIRI